MDKRQARELRQLANNLKKVPRRKFLMGIWGTGKLDPHSEGFECDFAGCAIGWMPKLVPKSTLGRAEDGLPEHAGRTGYKAIALYFGIENDEARQLFSNLSYGHPVTPHEVGSRIRGFLMEKGV